MKLNLRSSTTQTIIGNLPPKNELLCCSLTTGEGIEPVETVRDMVVILSPDCSWMPHIDHQGLFH